MTMRFLTRLTKGAGQYQIFDVPKYVKEFYDLKTGNYQGGVTLKNGTTTSCSIILTMHRDTLRGRVPEIAEFSKGIVEIWMYPDTWTPPERVIIPTLTPLGGES